MSDLPENLALAADFPATDRDDWHKLVEAALKGRSFDKLISKTYDGIGIEPLYERAANTQPITGRAAGEVWSVGQRLDHPDPAQANAQALQDLENGATGLALVFAGAPTARGFGVTISDIDALQQTLSGVMLDMISLRLETAPFAGRPVAEMMIGRFTESKADPAAAAIDFGLDPLGDMARTGGSPLPWPELSQRAGGTAILVHNKGFGRSRFLRADGRIVHDAGGSEAQELAFVLAAGVAYLRLLESTGFTLDEARRRISFLLAADADEFLTLAKFRALRKMWSRVELACGLAPQPANVAAETAWRMMTARDPYVNMLRTTLAVTAAGLGGADTITVLPFTLALGLPDAFARRVARNLQLILLEESNLYRVADPAAGSGIEALTVKIALSAWKLFQEIEAAGGAATALQCGLVQQKVTATRAAREAAIARRKDPITGISDYPNLGEVAVRVLDVPRSAAKPPFPKTFEVLAPVRLAEPFEALRDKSDTILAKTGARPKVFLATLGKLSEFNARAMFAKNFYEAGGIDATMSDGFGDQAAMIAAFKDSGARLACLCSSDKIYAHDAAAAASALKQAGATVHLAGRSGEHENAWNKAGVTTYIYTGCDVLATLRAAYETLDRA